LVWCPWNSDEIKRHPEVEMLTVTQDDRPRVMSKVLNWLTEGITGPVKIENMNQPYLISNRPGSFILQYVKQF